MRLLRWPWRQRAKPIEPRPMVSRAMELQTAKAILAEVFHARIGEAEEMIQRRLEESGPESANMLCRNVGGKSISLGLSSTLKIDGYEKLE
jgi:hypothetical protein